MEQPAGRGFTLVELLVVVAVIALLIGVLLPALGAARDTAQEMGCQSNVRQIGLAANMYANENDDQIWPYTSTGRSDTQDFTRSWKPEATNSSEPVWRPGLLHDYIDDADKLLDCPKAKRAGRSGGDEGKYFEDRYILGGSVNVWFDYTMLWSAEGARRSTNFNVAYPNDLTAWGRADSRQIPTVLEPRDVDLRANGMQRMRSLPLFIEESYFWENNGSAVSGNFARGDLWSERHRGAGSTAYLDGSVEMFDAPSAGRPEDRDAGDLYAGALFVQRNDVWINIGWDDRRKSVPRRPTNPPYYRFGWINGANPGVFAE